MLFVTNKFISCILIVLLVSCSSAAREELPLARVYDKYLYPSDIEGVVPDEVTGADSVQIIRSYLDNWVRQAVRSEEHTSELQSLMRISYAVFCLKKKQKLKN